MIPQLRVPCTYQGGKQRIAGQIADILIHSAPDSNTSFYDLCCGSGAISIELINRGVDPTRITMLDSSSWGTFWSAIGTGTFNIQVFEGLIADIPDDKRQVKDYMTRLSKRSPDQYEAEIYPILQACSFGGKQLLWDGVAWKNAFFREYWQPTATSVRRSPANPMQPQPKELERRIHEIARHAIGVQAHRCDVSEILEKEVPDNTVIYVDPPYSGTTKYGFGFDVRKFAKHLRAHTNASIFISEGTPLNDNAIELTLGGANGGISGRRVKKHREWLTPFQDS